MKYKQVMLDGGEHRGKTFALEKADHISLKEEGVFKRCVFKGLRAYAYLGPGKYYDCRFEDCRVRELHLGESVFKRCKFVDVRIHSLWSDGADIVDCVFSGVIKSGVLQPNSPSPSIAKTRQPRQIVGNDFSQCDLGSDVFRGGVDLRFQRFRGVGDECLVFDGPSFLERAQSALAGPALRAAVFLIQDVAQQIKWFEQSHMYVRMSRFDEDVPKRHREAILAVVRECAIETGQKRVSKKVRA